jgi:hypothetical protein
MKSENSIIQSDDSLYVLDSASEIPGETERMMKRFTTPIAVSNAVIEQLNKISERTQIPIQSLVNSCLYQSLENGWGDSVNSPFDNLDDN